MVIISWQVLSLAAKPPFNYDKYVEKVERIEAKLTAGNFAEAKVLLLSEEAEDKEKAKVIFNNMIQEYEGIKHNPKYRQKAMEEIASLNYKAGNYKEALIKAEETLKEYPKDQRASTVLALCLRQKANRLEREKKYNLAIAEYEKILEYPIPDGLSAFANYFIGRIYEKKGEMENATIHYREMIEKVPELGWKDRAEERLKKISYEK